LLHPLGRAFLDFLNHLAQRQGLREKEEQMNVISNATDFNGRAAEIVQCSGEIRKEARAQLGPNVRLPILGAEDEVNHVSGERLGHRRSPWVCRSPSGCKAKTITRSQGVALGYVVPALRAEYQRPSRLG
jgi:hypothetical protein